MASDGKQGTPVPEECHDAASAFAGVVAADPVPAMTTSVLLTSIIGRRSGESCRQLAALGDLRAVARLFPRELEELGFRSAEVARLEAFFELARRFGETPWTVGAPFRGSYDVYAHFRERLAEERREIFISVLLDNKNRKLKDVRISEGSLTASVVHPREVYLPAIKESAAAVVFVHYVSSHIMYVLWPAQLCGL